MQNKKTLKILGFLAGAALVGFLVYSVIEYEKSGIAEEGIVTCAAGECFWSAHIHAYIPVVICGEPHSFPKFKGALTEFHIHGEENVIHWHDKIPFDRESKMFLEPTPFALARVFGDLDLPLGENGPFGKKDGTACGDGKAGTWKVLVNGEYYPDWMSYEWKDRDIIFFSFGNESPEEVEQYIKENPFRFPFLGEG